MGNARLERREGILDATIRLFAERDFHSVQMDEIARSAGVAKGTLYYNFNSKLELYHAALTFRLDRLVRLLEQTYSERNEPWRNLRSYLIHWQAFMVRNPDFYRMWRAGKGRLEDESLQRLQQRLFELLCSVLRQGSRAGAFGELCEQQTASLILGMLGALVERQIAGNGEVEGPEPILELLQNGLGRGAQR
ncbi:MAG: TetR/AcrR family transcriptional regulator [Candidatus Alcyoniella australis]|nr:TetR/AcrR family transcriptional regulator [Candidatus Alcyoniella australis]